MAIKSIRILVRLDFPSKTMRFWDGSGPYIDQDGELWIGAMLGDALDAIEQALNGEALSMQLGLSGVPVDIANVAWQEVEDDDVIGSVVQLLIQDCDEYDIPVGDPEVRFTATVDDIDFDDRVDGDNSVSTVTLTLVNRFSLRTMSSGVVLSDTDQKARSAVLNPGAPPDRIAERVPLLQDKTIEWPKVN